MSGVRCVVNCSDASTDLPQLYHNGNLVHGPTVDVKEGDFLMMQTQ